MNFHVTLIVEDIKIYEISKSEKERITCCPMALLSSVCICSLSFDGMFSKQKNLLYFSRKRKELKKDSMTQREREKNRKENLTTLSFLQKSILIFFSNDFLYPSSQLKLASWKRLKHFEIMIFLLIKINYLWNDMASTQTRSGDKKILLRQSCGRCSDFFVSFLNLG